MPAVDSAFAPHEHAAAAAARRPASFGYEGATSATVPLSASVPIPARSGRARHASEIAAYPSGSPSTASSGGLREQPVGGRGERRGPSLAPDTLALSDASIRSDVAFDTLTGGDFHRYVAAMAPRHARAAIGTLRESRHPVRNRVIFDDLCMLYPKLKDIERRALVDYARNPASVVRRRPQLMHPIMEHWRAGFEDAAAKAEARMIADLIGSFSTDAEVVNFTRIVARKFDGFAAVIKDALRRRIGVMEGRESRRQAEENLRV